MVYSKTKKALALFTAFMMIASLAAMFCFAKPAFAASQTSGEWQYEEVDGGAKITAYLGTESTATVPSKLKNGLKVVSVATLGSSKSNSTSRLKSVSFSSGIKELGDGALSGLSNIEKVTINGATITKIGSRAFEGCTSLKTITLPSSLKTIGESAFSGCKALNTVKMECAVTVIPDRLFYGCSSLSTVTTPYYITKIGESAFSGCSKLKTVNLPSTLTSIGAYAFENCSSLTSPVLPTEKLTTISKGAYRNCTSIATIFVPNSVKTIGEDAFYGCKSLKNIYFSPSVKTIEKNALAVCPSLEKIVFGGQNNSFSGFFDTSNKPKLFYPNKYASSWASLEYSGKQAFSDYKATPSEKTLKLNMNKSQSVSVKATPTGTPLGSAYMFVSANNSIATVSNTGTILAKTPGKTTISVVTVMGTKTDITVTVYPAAPGNVKATPKSTSSIDVTWKAVNGASGYTVFRSTSKTGTYTSVGTTTTNSFTDKGVTKGKTYYYKIKATAKAGSTTLTSAYSAAASAAATSPTPSTFTLSKASAGKANIKWSKSLGASGYEVYMATSAKGTFSKVYTANSNTFSYAKSGLTAGKTYYFKVRSYITAGGVNVYSPYTTVKSVKV